MKILVVETEAWERDRLHPLEKEHELVFIEERLSDHNASSYSDVEVISSFIYSDLGKRVLERMDNLKLIATRSTGTDHIDVDYCDSRGITVCNVPTYGATTVAEHVFALLLAISRNLTYALNRTVCGEFSNRGLRGFELRKKTIGLLGTGDIGGSVVPMALGFGMKVIAFDPKPRDDLTQEYGLLYVTMEELLERSDIISLHVPLNEKTKHMIAKQQIEKMKDGAVIINTARGALIKIEDLAQALLSGKLKAAGLDVLPEEPVIREEIELLRSVYEKQHDLETLLTGQVLMRMRNVVITPHTAFFTQEAIDRIFDTTINNIRAFEAGEPVNTIGGGEQ